MESNRTDVSRSTGQSKSFARTKRLNPWLVVIAWWYRLVAPPEPLRGATFSQRETARHGKLAAITILIFLLFLVSLVPQMLVNHDIGGLTGFFIGLGVCFLVLILNRSGFVKIAGLLLLFLLYAGETFTLLTYPGGLTLSNIYILDYTVMPDLIALAFFSSNILILIFSLNAIQIGLIVVCGHHDAAISHLLNTAPLEIFAHLYILQLITACALYLWAHSTENAIARADRAEEIIEFEKREKEIKEQELAKKHLLDTGIQQLLQTHVAVANGDFSIRAPLHQDHELWQVAAALNNLIARMHRLSLSERELRQKVYREDESAGKGYRKVEQTRPLIPSIPKKKLDA